MHHIARKAVLAGLFSVAMGTGAAWAQGNTGSAAPAQGTSPNGANQGAPAAGRRGQFAGMARVLGEITAVNGSTLTVKAEDGSTMQVVTTDNTRLMKDRGPVRLADLHPGDGVMAAGNLDAPNKTLHAAMVFAEDAAQIKAMRDNLGKTYITGRVTAVDLDNARMTVERPDHVAQNIGFDETTSFKRAVRETGGSGGPGGSGSGGEGQGRGPGGGGFGGGMSGMAVNGGIDRAFSNGESITLADIKVGDFVAGTGTVKNGVFVPTKVVDRPAGQRRARQGAGESAPSTQPPGAR